MAYLYGDVVLWQKPKFHIGLGKMQLPAISELQELTQPQLQGYNLQVRAHLAKLVSEIVKVSHRPAYGYSRADIFFL
jgi:hypothetical protein